MMERRITKTEAQLRKKMAPNSFEFLFWFDEDFHLVVVVVVASVFAPAFDLASG